MAEYVPTHQRILVYIAARITSVERLQETIEGYYDAANLDPAAKTKLQDAYAILQTAQAKLIEALSAQASS